MLSKHNWLFISIFSRNQRKCGTDTDTIWSKINQNGVKILLTHGCPTITTSRHSRRRLSIGADEAEDFDSPAGEVIVRGDLRHAGPRNFSRGVDSLDNYLGKQAKQGVKRRIARVLAATTTDNRNMAWLEAPVVTHWQ